MIDIARILGIFLDNAIEANNRVNSHREINIAFFKSVSNSTIIIIENTLEDDEVMIEKIFTEGFSTKGKKHGKGLSTVKNIINNYQNVTLNTSLNNGLFTQVIEIRENGEIQ